MRAAEASFVASLLAVLTGCSHSSGPCTPGAAGADTGDFPSSVTSYCMFTMEPGGSGGVITPKAGVTPYDLNTPLFSDYAEKFRTVWMPAGTHVTYVAEGRFEFPVGTVITKSFGFPADFRVATDPVNWIETRVLVRASSGWKGTSYLWNAQHTDAQIEPGGEVDPFTFIADDGGTLAPNYLVPSQPECQKCHANDGAMITLGPSAEQLNRDFAYGANDSGVENELAHWSRLGLLEGAPSPDAAPKLAVFDDPTTGDVTARARAYLQANCSYCHNGNGEARTTGLVLLDTETDPYALGMCKPPVAAGKAGANEHYDIFPGDPSQSILVTRMASTEPSIAMPELGRSLEHVEAVAIVSDWIAGLDAGCGGD